MRKLLLEEGDWTLLCDLFTGWCGPEAQAHFTDKIGTRLLAQIQNAPEVEDDDLPAIQVGTILYGYCGGFFGRDSYEDKTVEAYGKDWVVCRDDQGRLHTAGGEHPDWDLLAELRKYQRKEQEDV